MKHRRGGSVFKGLSVTLTSRQARVQQRLLRNAPWCDFCEKFGRHLDPSSPDEGPRCVYWPNTDLEEWNVHAEACIQTWELIKTLWPEVIAPPANPSQRPAVGQTLIERIKSRFHVEDVARRLTDLRGNSTLTGKCPLHHEQHGRSFVVWPESQTWRCYGACSRGGDVIDLWAAAREAGYRL